MSIRHNELRDFTAELLDEVCKDVRKEPQLSELTGETFKLKSANTNGEARVDVSAREFWGRGTKAFLDVRIFNPIANCYLSQKLESAHISNEKKKKRKYNQRILDVEHGTFTPLVFSCFGGMSKECSAFFKRLTILIAEKRGQRYEDICSYIRTRISFSLIRVAVLCIRGCRKTNDTQFDSIRDIDLHIVQEEANLQKGY